MSGKAGSKIEDTNQELQYSLPHITPSGHEFSFYDTPDNQRLVVRHASGSTIEFKADGSVFIKAIQDLHVMGSTLSEPSTSTGQTKGGGDTSTMRFLTDMDLDVKGKLRISADSLEIDISDTTKLISGTDLKMTANNIESRADENIALEATKSIYVDTKEYRERSVSHRVEEGTMEDSGEGGGLNYMNVKGNFVINNTDPNGSITLMSAGYLNLVAGQERVDVTGQYTKQPSSLAQATYTNVVKTPGGGSLNKSSLPGDYYEDVATKRERKVGQNEDITITGIQKVIAAQIYLN